MEILLQNLPLSKISTSMTINSTATSLLAFYMAVAQKNKVSPTEIRGTIQNDVLKEYIARGTYIYPPAFSLKLIADSFRFANQNCPKWNPISISGYHIREAGSTAAQEIAFTLQNAFTYVETALQAGLKLEEFVPRLSFFFNVHNHFFEEVAKFRTARKIYAMEMQRRFDCPPQLLALRFHSQTAGSTLTAQQPMNNLFRVAYQALAAVLGGTQSLHTNSFDEALGLPTEESALLALRTQQVLAEETGVAQVSDPLAGSYYLESMCEEIEKKSLSIISEIDHRGGMLACIESGWVQREIQQAAYEAQLQIDRGQMRIVGVNCHSMNEESIPQIHSLNPRVVKDQKARLKKFKAKRKSKNVESALRDLQTQANELQSGNPEARVCETILSALKNHCTLGEVADVMRAVAGQYRA
jgi:methylmalonyl-CoA mutase N-terminal domain/subunit